MNTDRLTREQVLAMKPGRELDALVAGKVMGYTTHGQFREKNGVRVMIDRYSADIAAAWEVVEKSINWGGMEIGCYGNANGKWFVASTYTTNAKIGKSVSATAHTAPEAICKAALLAVMDGEDEAGEF